VAGYSFPVEPSRRAAAGLALQSLLASKTWPLTRTRPKGATVVDLRANLVEAELTLEGLLQFRLKVASDGSARPEELLEALEIRDLLDRGVFLTRTNLELSEG
jgi:hypothetical protein